MRARAERSLPGPGRAWLEPAAVLLAAGVLAAVYIWVGDDHSDIGVYHRYALAFFEPGGAARHLPLEYPPLSLAPFSLTLLPVGVDFGAVFAGAMAALFLASCAVVAHFTSRRAATAYAIYMLAAGPWVLFGRYDLVPSLVVLGAVAAAGRGRWRPAYALLALGVLLKLYPIFLLPLFAIDQWRRDDPGRRDPGALARKAAAPGLFGLIVLVGFAAAAIVDRGGWLSPFRYALERPVEAESVQATALWLLSGFGVPGRLDHTFNSLNVISPSSGALGAVFAVVLVAGCAAAYIRLSTGRLTLRGACLACLAVVIVASKVQSPQYLVWLLPLVALEVGLEPVWVGVCALTFLVYPILYELAGMSDSQQATAYAPVFLFATALRNLLLLAVTWRALRGPIAARAVAAA